MSVLGVVCIVPIWNIENTYSFAKWMDTTAASCRRTVHRHAFSRITITKSILVMVILQNRVVSVFL